MKRILALGFLLGLTSPVLAQSTAVQAITGYLDTTGCPSGQTVCFKQYGAGGASSVTADIGSIDGNTALVGPGLSGNGSLRTTEASAAPASSSALAANAVVCNTGCSLTSFNVSADSTLASSAWYIMIYNAVSAPSDGAVTPVKCYSMPSGSTGIAAAFPIPLNLTTGAVIGVSTTGCFTKTASTHAFISGDSR